MRRICEELEHLGEKYRIVKWDELTVPLESYPTYVLILYLDIMRYRDDLIYGLCILEELTRAGVKILPPLKGFYNSDKFANYLLWHRYLRSAIRMPDTLCSINLEISKNFMKKHQKIIFKPISGSQGIGIEIVQTETRLKELLEHHHTLFLQELIPDRGYDLRTLLVGDQFIIQYARYNPQKFLKNIHLGAIPKSIQDMEKIDPEIQQFAEVSRKIAREVQKIAEIDIVGVDTLPSKDGELYLLEWNSVPGFKGAEEATHINIAKEIVKFIFSA
ncbi:MAG: ATP-grasp domain-containing protein [Candidatus Helarchaeota archaeon]